MKSIIQYLFDRWDKRLERKHELKRERENKKIDLLQSEKELIKELKSKEILKLQEKYNAMIDRTESIRIDCERIILFTEERGRILYEHYKEIVKIRQRLHSVGVQASEEIGEVNANILYELKRFEKIKDDNRKNKLEMKKLFHTKFEIKTAKAQ